MLGKWDRDLDSKVTALVVQTLETGATHKQLMKSLAGVFSEFSKLRLENIARTETMAALNQGRIARFKAPDSSIVAVQFMAIIDSRVTEICRSRDGLIMRLDDPRLPANTPPLHYQCRSTLVPVSGWMLEDLESGDEAAIKRAFGWLNDEAAPKSLKEALAGWDKAEPPLKGFGKVGEGAGSKPPKVGGEGPPRKPPKTPSVADGGEEPDDAPLKKWDNIIKFHSFVYGPPMSPVKAREIRLKQMGKMIGEGPTNAFAKRWDGWQIRSDTDEARDLQREWEALKGDRAAVNPFLREAFLASLELIPKTIIKPVTLYRGFSLAKVSDQILAAAILGREDALVSARTLNSWSSSRQTAENYAKGGVVAVRTFKPEAIVGGLGLSPGFGDFKKAIEEREVVLPADVLKGDNSGYILELLQVTSLSWGGRTAAEQVEWLRSNNPKELERIMQARGEEQANFAEVPLTAEELSRIEKFQKLSKEEQDAFIKERVAERWSKIYEAREKEEAAFQAALDAVPYPRLSGEWFKERTRIENEYYGRRAKNAYKLTVAMYDDPMFGAERAALAAKKEAQKQQ